MTDNDKEALVIVEHRVQSQIRRRVEEWYSLQLLAVPSQRRRDDDTAVGKY